MKVGLVPVPVSYAELDLLGQGQIGHWYWEELVKSGCVKFLHKRSLGVVLLYVHAKQLRSS